VRMLARLVVDITVSIDALLLILGRLALLAAWKEVWTTCQIEPVYFLSASIVYRFSEYRAPGRVLNAFKASARWFCAG